MLCISIGQESRRMALVDMYNAANQCDLIEIRLDRLQKAHDFGDLLANKPKPVIMSCRRQKDGGDWKGSESDRLMLLRQCVVSKADYVEVELDVADAVKPIPPTGRVISYTNLSETPDNIEDIYDQARSHNPEVIKLVTAARTPEEAWPLVQIVARSSLPTVVVGVGKPGVMLSVLGKRIGAPWAYAALERGMETYPGQATVRELETVYHYREINRHTRFVGVSGFDETQRATVAALNGAFAMLERPVRCLPIQVGDLRLFRKVRKAVKLHGVVVDEPNRVRMTALADEFGPFAQVTQAVDLVFRHNNVWHGYDTLARAAIAAMKPVLKEHFELEKPFKKRLVLIVGISATARSVAHAVKERGALVMIASHHREAATRLALELGCRLVPFDAIYSTQHELLIVCDDLKEMQDKARPSLEAGVHASILRQNVPVLDLTALPFQSPLGREAVKRGCTVILPRNVLLAQLILQVRLLTGKQVPEEVLEEVLRVTMDEEE